jgi:hypothetical protein
MYKSQPLDRDHVIDRALGGAQGPAVLAHRWCNRSAGARLGNQIYPRTMAAGGRDTICTACGKVYSRAPRACEICGAHYHPNHGGQRSCSRACGVVLMQRNRMARGWVPKAQRPKPPPRVPAEPYAPRSSVAYYTCRYCGKLGVTTTRGQVREVCPARPCQLARLQANNLRARNGVTREDADDFAVRIVQSPPPRSITHCCPRCGEQTANHRWCDECLCTDVNAKGKRCGLAAGVDGQCEHHAHDGGRLASSRTW